MFCSALQEVWGRFRGECLNLGFSVGRAWKISSAGETFKLEINAGKNSMAAQMACIELEKQLTFIALTG